MPDGLLAASALSLLIWLYLALFHGRYWRADQRLSDEVTEPNTWPSVAAVIPARNEESVIGSAVESLFGPTYPGSLQVIVVDDQSSDNTAEVARDAASQQNRAEALTVIEGQPLGVGWSGKLWAVDQGVKTAVDVAPDAKYLLLTDADIVHDRIELRRLIAKAESERLDLASLMVLLHCRSPIERLLIPAFVYFFQQVYPFPEANTQGSKVAAAAGGCMLVRRDALDRAGGIESIHDALIDDCALAARIKATGSIWIGLAERSQSIRPYEGIRGIWAMVARSAYTQLKYSPLILVGTVLGLIFTYLVPPIATGLGLIGGNGQAASFAVIAWLIMIMTYAPTLRLYRQSVLFGLALPIVALLYTFMTIDSAIQHSRGEGGAWKGRTYSGTGET